MRYLEHTRPTDQPRSVPSRALALLALVAALLPLLAGCGLHPGGDAIAFLRGRALWVVNPDGSNPREIAAGPVAGFAWSPNHQWLVYRTGAGSTASAPTPGSPLGQPDDRGHLVVVSINGGAGVTISPDLASLAHSDGWWDANGNRLLYREESAPVDRAALVPSYIVSQNDQPLGIARKYVYDAASLPTLSPDGQQVAVIDPAGDVRLGAPGQPGAVVAQHALLTWTQSGRPTRILWQPGHDAFLYESPTALWGFQAGADDAALVLQSASGGSKTARALFALAPDTLDLAFSPDGASLLVHGQQDIAFHNLAHLDRTVDWPESDPAAQTWWSPNARYVLIQDNQGLRLGSVATGKITTVLTYATPLDNTLPQSPFWTPTDASPWRADSSGFVFASDMSARWEGGALPQGNAGEARGYAAGTSALYAVTLANGTAGTPTFLVAGVAGAVYAPTWSYLDPSAALLQGS